MNKRDNSIKNFLTKRRESKSYSRYFILSIIIFSFLFNICFIFGINFSSNQEKRDSPNNPINNLKESQIGEDSWWNVNWEYRQCINISNPYNYNLESYSVYFQLNHSKLVNEGKIRTDLADLRIIQDDNLLKYYYTTDYPYNDIARIWFESDISPNSETYNTYMYYGNENASIDGIYFDADHFGMAWYDFENEGSTTARDLMGKNNGTIYDVGINTNYVTGYQGNWALDFEDTQTSGYIDVPYSVINGVSQFTICFWATQSDPGDQEYIISGYYGTDNYMLMRAPNQPGWHFYVWQRNGSGTHIYTDLIQTDGLIYSNPGEPVYITPGGLIVAQEQDSLGDGFAGNQAFSGIIDDLRFFNYNLSYTELLWIYNNYNLDVMLLEEQQISALIDITIRDIDGRPLPNAKVSLVNNSLPIENRTLQTLVTSNNGKVIFSDIPFGEYDLTINYTLNNGTYLYENLIYNSSNYIDGTLSFYGLFENRTIHTDIWSIDFKVDDWENEPVNLGYILVYNETSTNPLLANLSLNSGLGKTTFRWLNRSHYYYEIYYYNEDYLTKNNLLDSGFVNRENKVKIADYSVISTAVHDIGNIWKSNITIYAEGSSSSNIGKNMIIKYCIELEDMTDHLGEIQLRYFDKDMTWKIIEGSYKDYESSDTSDKLLFNIYDNYVAYGLEIVVSYFNTSISNGQIHLNYSETTNLYYKAAMSKLSIYTFDKSSEHLPIQYMLVKIVNNTGYSIANLITNNYGEARGYNNDIPFWYFHGDYFFSLSFYGSNKSFRVTESDKYFDSEKEYYELDPYNYTLDIAAQLRFNVTINIEDFQSRFQDTEGISDVNWGENMYFSVNYTIKTPELDWHPIQNPDYVRYEITKLSSTLIVLSGDMNSEGNGNYSLTLNSNVLIGEEWYKIRIYGRKIGYIDPYDKTFDFEVKGIKTGIYLHNYTTKNIIISNKTSEFYNKEINITLSYFELYNPSQRITGAYLTYNIPDLSEFSDIIYEDQLSPGYYTFTIDTSIFPNIDQYKIEITANKDNYTYIDDYEILLDIKPIPTVINGQSREKIIDEIPVLHAKNYIFEYNDTINEIRISECNTKYYEWNRLDDDGNFLYGDGNEGIGFLVESLDHLYILDFDTELQTVGRYSIAVYLQKQNYLIKFADLTITIVPRPINKDIIGFPSKQLNIAQGKDLILELNIVDFLTSDPLTDANVTLVIQGYNPINAINLGSGIYRFEFSTSGIDTFFIPKSFVALIIIEKENYETIDFEFNIVVGMIEIIPGFPMFYFLMIVIGIGAITGSLVGYRYIQIARIPEFIKKSRKLKKEINSNKTISDSTLYPSKEFFIAKILGDKWKKLGLSLEDTLRLEGKKMKKYEEKKSGGVK
ncbi:MAG: hypothetical protein JXA99_16930 [Candidatus Lokiarchaeota archaeon]|nr:hypothetical protein [Candidatus Lokiarchaeota archaeon]